MKGGGNCRSRCCLSLGPPVDIRAVGLVRSMFEKDDIVLTEILVFTLAALLLHSYSG